MARKLTPELERTVLGKAAEGWSSRRISKWLADEHSVKLSHVSIAKMVEAVKNERGFVAKAVLREKLVPQVISDIDRLAKHQRQLDAMADELFTMREPEAYAKMVEQLRKLTETKLHYSGADQPDQAATAVLLDVTKLSDEDLERVARGESAGQPPGKG